MALVENTNVTGNMLMAPVRHTYNQKAKAKFSIINFLAE
jgi:hypothetical protein